MSVDLRDLHAYGGLLVLGVSLGVGLRWWVGLAVVAGALFYLGARR